jgi:hypothetical protein
MNALQWGPSVVEVSSSRATKQVSVACRSNTSAEPAAEPAADAMLAAPMPRSAMAINISGGEKLLQALGFGCEDDAAYWTPTVAMGEAGLLEAFARKTDGRPPSSAAVTDGLDAFILVYSRPADELRRNFSNHRGERIDLSLPQFQLSHTTAALRALDHMSDDMQLRGKDVKDGLKHNLPRMAQDAFFLVIYRDYSSFATSTFSNEARRSRFGGKKFVERHFAIRVGQAAGVFVPITSAQFQRGWEILAAQEISPTSQRGTDPLTRWALTQEQFRGLGVLPPDVRAQPRFGQQTESEAVAAHRAPFYKPGQPTPHAWDLSPSALQWRIQRSLERQYLSVGRTVVKVAVVVAGVTVVRYAFAQGHDAPRSRSRGNRGRQADQRTLFEAAWDSARTANPFALFDFMAGR